MSEAPDKLHLIKALPLHGRRLIEASAGTGKTFTLAGLYLRLVLGIGCEPRMPPDILVLTFTRAATRELRERIRTRLIEAARAFRLGETNDEYLRYLLEQFDAQEHSARARMLDIAAGWMDEAAIHTIHAWCQTMLRQHAFDSGSLFEQDVDSPDPGLFGNAVADYWRTFWYPDHPYSSHLLEIVDSFEAFSSTATKLCRTDAPILSAGQEVTPLSPREFLEQIRERETVHGKAVTEALLEWPKLAGEPARVLENALAQGHFYADSKSKAVKEAKAALPRILETLDDWKEGTPFPQDLELLRPDRLEQVCKNNKTPRHPWLDRLQEALDEMGGYPDCSARIWLHARNSIQQKFREEKNRANRLDFEDLLVHLDEALARPGGERLRRTILEQYPVALVDEFQDTDPVQYRIFRRVWGACDAEDERFGLYLIGDPKQSIYSFRGADIHAYMAAREDTAGQYTLDRNFRSTEGMVEAVNHLFECGDDHPQGAFAFSRPGKNRGMPFDRVAANGIAETLFIDDEPARPMILQYHPEAEGRNNIGVVPYREIMAEQAAESIAELLGLAAAGRAEFRKEDGCRAEPVRPADIAVLVRKKSQAELVREALARRGVTSVYLSDRDSIFDTEQARDLGLILHAIAEPGDERRVRSALAVRLFGWAPDELDVLNHDERRLERELERFKVLLDTWRHQGVLAMVHRLLADFDIPARLLADPAQGERALTNVLHLAELLQAESQLLEGEHAIAQWLQDQIDLEDRGQHDEQVLRLESDADRVRIATIHSSKGLEYPLVFVPFACDYRQAGNDVPLVHHDGTRRVIDLAPDDNARARAVREALQEELRLFYVAVTRARHACWLGVAPVRNGGSANAPAALESFPFGHLLLGLAEDLENPGPMRDLLDRLVQGAGGCIEIRDVDSTPARTMAPAMPEQVLDEARTFGAAAREAWWIASYSALKMAHEAGPMVEPRDAVEDRAQEDAEMLGADGDPDTGKEPTATQDAHGFPRGPRPGTFLHGLLEWAGLNGFAETVADPGAFNELIERRCRLRGWSRWTPVVQQWMHNQLLSEMVLADRQLRLADLGRRQYTPELEFWFQATDVHTKALDELVRARTLDGAGRPGLALATLNGMMRGFIDLVFEHEGRYYVLDYKSNHLGTDDAAYSQDNMRRVVLDKRYDMQYALYTLALHRLLKSRLPGYDYDRHVGGAVYLFLRGCDAASGGVFHQLPERGLIEQLDEIFAGERADHAA